MWLKISERHSNDTFSQLTRYLFSGGLAFVVDFGTLFLLTRFAGFYYLLSAAIAFLLGLTTNYSLSVSWVFSHRALKHKGLEFGIFAAIGLLSLVINQLTMWSLTEYLTFHYLVSKLFATGFLFLFNFLLCKYTLFSEAGVRA